MHTHEIHLTLHLCSLWAQDQPFMIFAFLCAARLDARHRKCNEDMGLKLYWAPMKGKQTI